MMSAQGGGTPKADAVRKLSQGGCVKMQNRGRGSKNPKILQTSYVHGPLPFLKIYAVGIRGIFQLITSCSSCFENTFQELGV